MGNPARTGLLLALLALPAVATTSEDVDVTCPVCTNAFQAETWNSTNNVGGQDRDFCRHAAGGQVFIMICWTCPRCYFTGAPAAFDAEKNAESKPLFERLRKTKPLKPAVKIDPATKHSGRIPAWVRYDLLRQVAELDDTTKPLALASICLRTAQTQRFEWASLEDADGWDAAFKRLEERIELPSREEASPYDRDVRCAFLFERLAADQDAKLPAEDRVWARVLGAVYYKRRGEDRDALRLVESFRADKGLDAKLRAILDDVEKRIEIESKYRARAIPHFEKGLAGLDADSEDAACIRYLIGVLQRGSGEAKKAVESLKAARAMKGMPEPMKAWVDDEIAKANGAPAGRPAG